MRREFRRGKPCLTIKKPLTALSHNLDVELRRRSLAAS